MSISGAGMRGNERKYLKVCSTEPGIGYAMWETSVQSVGWEDALEKEMATHPNILAWRIPWTEEPTVHGVAESDTTELLSLSKNPISIFRETHKKDTQCYLKNWKSEW